MECGGGVRIRDDCVKYVEKKGTIGERVGIYVGREKKGRFYGMWGGVRIRDDCVKYVKKKGKIGERVGIYVGEVRE